jgi:hypothetical protein
MVWENVVMVENPQVDVLIEILSLLEIMSYATTMFATGMQLPVACNYARFFMQLQWIFATFLGVYETMVQL